MISDRFEGIEIKRLIRNKETIHEIYEQFLSIFNQIGEPHFGASYLTITYNGTTRRKDPPEQNAKP